MINGDIGMNVPHLMLDAEGVMYTKHGGSRLKSLGSRLTGKSKGHALMHRYGILPPGLHACVRLLRDPTIHAVMLVGTRSEAEFLRHCGVVMEDDALLPDSRIAVYDDMLEAEKQVVASSFTLIVSNFHFPPGSAEVRKHVNCDDALMAVERHFRIGGR